MNCLLCETPSKRGEFCCPGCASVWDILKQRGELEQKSRSPLFQQAIRAGVIAAPYQENDNLPQQGLGKKVYFNIQDLWCPACAKVISWLTQKERGVFFCIVDYTTDFGWIEFDPMITSEKALFTFISKLGYSPKSIDEEKKEEKSGRLRLSIALFCALNVMMFSYPLYAASFVKDLSVTPFLWIAGLSSLPIFFLGLLPMIKKAYYQLKAGIIGMEGLISIAALSALSVSIASLIQGGEHVYFDTFSVLITFVLLGKEIERAVKRSTGSILELIALSLPKRARVNGRFVPIAEVKIGDEILVKEGEKIVLDGVVSKGECTVSEAVVTGEALPVEKKTGARVIAGSTLLSGRLYFRATTTSKRSTLAQLLGVIEKELKEKGTPLSPLDRLLNWFVPSVFALAIFAFFFHTSANTLSDGFLAALSVLIVACPCAIGLAAPLVEGQVIDRCARAGGIVKNRSLFEKFQKNSCWVFDKTGTITEGKFSLVSSIEALSSEELGIVKGLALFSSHPMAKALYLSLKQEAFSLDHLVQYNGLGVKGEHAGCEYFLGSHTFVSAHNTSNSPYSTLYFSSEERLIASFAFEDQLRKNLPIFEDQVLLSGDRTEVVKKVAHQASFTHYFAECNPLKKCEVIKELQKKKNVIMIGDGMNDAPALSAADVGVSLSSGQEMTLQVCDLLLLENGLTNLPKIQKIVELGELRKKQNLFWAFFYNGIALIFAVCGLLHPLISAIAMILSSIVILINSRRLTPNI